MGHDTKFKVNRINQSNKSENDCTSNIKKFCISKICNSISENYPKLDRNPKFFIIRVYKYAKYSKSMYKYSRVIVLK